ncbi:MAG: AAA family ATPase [Caldilineaceae bacterium]|nr:AAA family ATPase [Caldilineaceae bacterium]
MTDKNKRGMSRRKGDEYQDVTALRFALENYIARKSFRMFLEYEKAGNLDDIVLFQETNIGAYQVKYAVNPLAVYGPDDLINPESKVYLGKLADSWNALRKEFPDLSLTVYLCSNRGLDSALFDLVTGDGAFKPGVIKDRRRGNAKKLRSDLASASGLDVDSFSLFLADFQFHVRRPTLPELELHIQTALLDRELGISDTAIFLDLKEAMKQNAMDSRDPVTFESIDKLLERLQSKLLVPQVFPVNQDHFVERKSFSNQLDDVLPQTDGEYLIVTGLPGSGKSTSLTTYFRELDRNSWEVFNYYCFVDVNDNAQKMRVRADSLRENLLNEFHRKYPDVLKRRYDYSESNFLICLKKLAEYFVEQGRKFVIFLDGLDHAERLSPEIRDTVVSALPSDVPEGVVIVVGTQELHTWPHFLKRAKEIPGTHVRMPLFTTSETQDYLVNKRGISGLLHADIVDIHRKCEGLPLYLRYAAEIILSNDAVSDRIASLTPATGGDIRNYYRLLWEEFDRVEMGNARHLCAVMACLRFSVHRNELHAIQKSLIRPQFEDAYKYISHLLRDSDDRLAVFHNSFREFTLSQLDADWIQEIKSNIVDFLKTGKDSPKWFEHVFEYCYEVGDYEYILKNVDADFVDRALLRFRPSEDIVDAFHWGVESAYKQGNIVQLSRLGTLKFRTGERLKHYLDRALLADVLLALGREQDVISFAYSPEADRWIVDNHTSLAVMLALAEKGRLELGRKFFDVFTNEFRGIHSDSSDGTDDARSQIIGIARCLGIYSEQQARPLRWLSRIEFSPGILERTDSYAPGYAPHLAAYIDALVQFGHTSKWDRLKRVKKIFPNRLVRYLLIRALARYACIDELRTAVAEYVEQEHPRGNVELAYYAAQTGMPSSEVSAIAGFIETPKVDRPKRLKLMSDPVLMQYAYSFVILGYEDNESSYRNLCETIGTSQTLWNCALRHLLEACYCIGLSFRHDQRDWYAEACESIDILVNAERGDGERIVELIDLFRDVLQFTIGSLTKEIQERFPERLDAWIEKLISLRDSFLWNTHFGISESREDYDFELSLWAALANHSMVRPKLAPILKSCAATYEESTLLKGDSRPRHFLWLAAIMAKCGMREDAEKWLNYGIRSSLIYGYRKDTTLSHLIDVLRLVNQHQPEMALERCARVLWMVKWMPHLTDGRGTKHFTEEAFSAVLVVSRQAAFELLRHFSHSIARWKMENCLEEYLLSAKDGDPEYLWCLTESFTNQNTTAKARRHIVELVRRSCSEDIQRTFEDRYRHFVLTEVAPGHWPDDLKDEFSIPSNPDGDEGDDVPRGGGTPSSFILDGESIIEEDIAEICRTSFSEFLETLEKLKTQNDRFYEPELFDEILRHHIAKARSLEELITIKDYVELRGSIERPTLIAGLAERFLDFGEQETAIKCFGLAYACDYDWNPWRSNAKYLTAVAKQNREAAETYLLRKCYNSATGSGGGYVTSPFAAAGLDVLNEPCLLEAVFNDHLTHCESMFAQLPQGNDYVWLKECAEPDFDENQRILQFSLEELGTQEIDLGERLIRALARLAIARPQSAIPPLISKALSSSGRILRRLLMILHTLAAQRPDLLVSHQQKLSYILDREDFLCRQTAMYILQRIREVSPLESSVANAIQRIDRIYSATVSYPTYRLSSSPSASFSHFLRQHTLLDFLDQVNLAEKILQVSPGSLGAAIEEHLGAQDWSMYEERSRIKDDWDGRVHPQGWPIVWITTEFHELATDAVWSILNEAAAKMKLSHDQIHWLWQTTQAVDPEYIVRGIMTRPLDIKMLRVIDKGAWFKELDEMEAFQIGNDGLEEQSADWITVFEQRILREEDERSHVPYSQELMSQATLIPLQVYGGSHALEELEFAVEPIMPHWAMPVTLEQARDILLNRGVASLNVNDDCFPLIAEHPNPRTFFGYWSVCTLASFIIEEFNLVFEGFDLTKEGRVVAKYEVWQEGYQNSAYTRNKISFGVRLRVRRDFLTDVCRRYRRVLGIRIDETRAFRKYPENRDPDTEKDSRRYVIYHL